MKTSFRSPPLFFTAALLFLGVLVSASASVSLPKLSPKRVVSQEIGYSKISVDYSSPMVRGRKIFGGLVPYGELWRTGANDATTLSFSEDVEIANEIIPAGDYSLITIPGEQEWTVIFNRNLKAMGRYGYSQDDDQIRFTVPAAKIVSPVEALDIDIVVNSFAEVTLAVAWEQTRIQFCVHLATDKRVAAEIEKTLASGKEKPGELMTVAGYLLYTENAEKAFEYVEKYEGKIGDLKNYRALYFRATLLERLGRNSEVIDTAKRAIVAAKKASDQEFSEEVIKRCEEMITRLSDQSN